jgi:hypothetical protein
MGEIQRKGEDRMGKNEMGEIQRKGEDRMGKNEPLKKTTHF